MYLSVSWSGMKSVKLTSLTSEVYFTPSLSGPIYSKSTIMVGNYIELGSLKKQSMR